MCGGERQARLGQVLKGLVHPWSCGSWEPWKVSERSSSTVRILFGKLLVALRWGPLAVDGERPGSELDPSFS